MGIFDLIISLPTQAIALVISILTTVLSFLPAGIGDFITGLFNFTA